jgi:hypothetical protein
LIDLFPPLDRPLAPPPAPAVLSPAPPPARVASPDAENFATYETFYGLHERPFQPVDRSHEGIAGNAVPETQTVAWQRSCKLEDWEGSMRAAIRVLMTLFVVGLIVFLVLGYWAGSTWSRREPGAVGSSGTISTATARERGAELGEKAANAAAEMKQTLTEASLTAKIKAKMALDDSVKARTIDVTTSGSTVTLTGKINSPAERERAVSLARETDGITAVVDRLEIHR